VRARFERIFQTVKFKIAFTIHEVVEMGDLAYARSSSVGQQEVLEAHEKSKVAHNELFIFRKEQGHWKIHRYIFAAANPPTDR
jgi:ketosteroid isomerase-like protein